MRRMWFQFNRSDNLAKHLRNEPPSPSVQRCFFCSKYFALEISLDNHEKLEHDLNESKHPKRQSTISTPVDFTTTAVNNTTKIHRLKLTETDSCIDSFNCVLSQKRSILDLVYQKLYESFNLNVSFSIAVKLVKPLTSGFWTFR